MQTLLSQVFRYENFSKAFWSFVFAFILGFTAWLSALYFDVQGIKAMQADKGSQIYFNSERIRALQSDVKEIKQDVKTLLSRQGR